MVTLLSQRHANAVYPALQAGGPQFDPVTAHHQLSPPHFQIQLAKTACSGFSWQWRRRSPSKVKERTHEEATEALHAGRKSRHSEAASIGAGSDLRVM